jgi:Na+-transporting NADH:ubiquinone oxidoreductase subunit A
LRKEVEQAGGAPRAEQGHGCREEPMRFTIKRGLTLEPAGAPAQVLDGAMDLTTVALLGCDYPGLKPSLVVAEGERVRAGQVLMTDRRDPALRFVAPVAGRILAIRRGDRRRVEAIVIERARADAQHVDFSRLAASALLDSEALREGLLASGLWTALRTRPFGEVPLPGSEPLALLVTAIDTHPLAPDPVAVIALRRAEFLYGLGVLQRLVPRTLVCKGPALDLSAEQMPGIEIADFVGPHPAGLAGTHVEYLFPQLDGASIWTIGYQDVIAIGTLFLHGRLDGERIVAVAGPGARRPRLVRLPLGAALDEVLALEGVANARARSGSLLSGCRSDHEAAYLGRYATQVTLLAPAAPPAPIPPPDEPRGGMLPLERFEAIWPFASPVLPFLRALLTRDVENAVALGCLGLLEEDLALCAHVCPARIDYGAALQATLADYRASA